MLKELEKFAHTNFHIHTNISYCADSNMTVENIIKRAEEIGLKKIILVDHDHPYDDIILSNIEKVKEEVEKTGTKIDVVVGAELSAYDVGKYADSITVNKKIDYRLYACNHYNMSRWSRPKKNVPEEYAIHMMNIMRKLLVSGRADCIAHPFVVTYLKENFDNNLITKSIAEKDLYEILKLGKENNVAWELNSTSALYDPVFVKRFWEIGNKLGVNFNFGTDAHTLSGIDPRKYLEKIDKILN